MDGAAAQAARRAEIFRNEVSADTFQELHAILQNAQNPYLAVYQQARDTAGGNVAIRIASSAPVDVRRYNAPAVSEVAALIVDSGGETHGRDIILRRNGGGLQRIYTTNQAYDALAYPLLFPRGEAGWQPGMQYFGENHATKLTLLDYNKFHLQVRGQGTALSFFVNFSNFRVQCAAQLW